MRNPLKSFRDRFGKSKKPVGPVPRTDINERSQKQLELIWPDGTWNMAFPGVKPNFAAMDAAARQASFSSNSDTLTNQLRAAASMAAKLGLTPGKAMFQVPSGQISSSCFWLRSLMSVRGTGPTGFFDFPNRSLNDLSGLRIPDPLEKPSRSGSVAERPEQRPSSIRASNIGIPAGAEPGSANAVFRRSRGRPRRTF